MVLRPVPTITATKRCPVVGSHKQCDAGWVKEHLGVEVTLVTQIIDHYIEQLKCKGDTVACKAAEKV